MNILKSLFGNSSQKNEKEKTEEKNFDILKYDGVRAQHIGKIEYAIRCFEEAIAIKEDIETMNFLANAYIHNNQLNDAHEILNKVCTINAEDAKNFLALASVCFLQEDYDSMQEATQKAIALDDNNPLSYYLSAKAYIGQNNDIMAIAMLTKAITLKEDYTEAYLLRANTLNKMKQTNDALADIEHILLIDADEENALLLKGEILSDTENTDAAHECFNHVLSINPFNEKAYLLGGELYVTYKELDKAIELYNEAIEINPNFARAYHERGRIRLLNGDKDGSVEDMKKALELAPESESKINGEYNNYDDITKNVPW